MKAPKISNQKFNTGARGDGCLGRVAVAAAVLLALIVGIVGFTWAASAQNPQLVYVKAYPDGTHQITINAETFWAVGVERARALREAEQTAPIFERDLKMTQGDLKLTQNDLQISRDNLQGCKDNLQDERVKSANLKIDFDAQGKLLGQCLELSKQGGKVNGFLNKWPVRLVTEFGLPAVNMVKCK